MRVILVTGGAGFIGSSFVRLALRRSNARVVALDKLTYAGTLLNLQGLDASDRFTFVQGDIADGERVEEVFAHHAPDTVVNFAAESHVDRSIDGPRPFVRTNVNGTFELLEASRKRLASLSAPERSSFRFLHVSTDEVYGSLGETGKFTEATAYSPRSPYSASKAASDHFVSAYWHTFGVPTLITNCSNNYGPRQFPEKLLPVTILNAVEGKALPIYGDGGNVRDWLHVEDHCEGILSCLERGAPGEKYNFGGDSERTNLQVVDAVCAALERLLPAHANAALKAAGVSSYRALKTFVPDRPGHDRRYAIDASRARRELGWSPRHEFEAGIEATVRWYLENRAWCQQVQAEKLFRRDRLGLSVEPGSSARVR